jgi:hypothetical protein
MEAGAQNATRRAVSSDPPCSPRPRLSAAACNRFTCPSQVPFPTPNGAEEILRPAPAPRHGAQQVLSMRRHRHRSRRHHRSRVPVVQLVLPAGAGADRGTFLDAPLSCSMLCLVLRFQLDVEFCSLTTLLFTMLMQMGSFACTGALYTNTFLLSIFC